MIAGPGTGKDRSEVCIFHNDDAQPPASSWIESYTNKIIGHAKRTQ